MYVVTVLQDGILAVFHVDWFEADTGLARLCRATEPTGRRYNV